ncbi:MAG: hypothetical protein ACLSUW_01325 [Akkermansia sp.]
MNLLLQILEGSVTDSLGRKIQLPHHHHPDLQRGAASVRGRAPWASGAMTLRQGGLRRHEEKILEEARKQFRPEFLNRFDKISVFHVLERTIWNISCS